MGITRWPHPLAAFYLESNTALWMASFVAKCPNSLQKVHIIYTDFSMVLDSINPTIPLPKFATVNISLSLITWLPYYLSNLYCIFRWLNIPLLSPTSGPHGSILSPRSSSLVTVSCLHYTNELFSSKASPIGCESLPSSMDWIWLTNSL